jgi:hypothetical protein
MITNRHGFLRSRLRAAHGADELRQAQFDARITAIATSLAELSTVAQQQTEEIRALAAGQRQLLEGQAEVRTRLRRTQALTARTYEALQRWPDQLAAARESDLYARAYQHPEPLISIPIPTYHAPGKLCDRALASVRAQTYERWEAIVVGDHCTDSTEARVRAIGDPRIRFYNLPVRESDSDDPWERWAVKGSVPRATGIGLSEGEWIAPLSHDDAWDPHHLQTLLDAAREARAEVAYSQMRVRNESDGDRLTGIAIGAWPPRLGQFGWQSSMVNGALGFLRYDRRCALASEPNDWNLARRAWEAGVRFQFVDAQTVTLYQRDWTVTAELEAQGLPSSAAAYP